MQVAIFVSYAERRGQAQQEEEGQELVRPCPGNEKTRWEPSAKSEWQACPPFAVTTHTVDGLPQGSLS